MFNHSLTESAYLPPAPVHSRDEREAFTRAFQSIGQACAERRARIDSRAVSHLRELAREAQSAAGEALARFIDRASRLGVSSARETLGFLPRRGRFPRSVYRAGHKAVDHALRRMARREGADVDAFRMFDASGWIDAANACNPDEYAMAEGFACMSIRLRATQLRESIRAKAQALGTQGASKSAGAHLRRVDAWEARALALARGEGGESLPVLSLRPASGVVVSESARFYVNAGGEAGRDVATDGRGGTSGTRKRRVVFASDLHASGFDALRRLRAFIGELPPPPSAPRSLTAEERAEFRAVSAVLWAGVARREAEEEARNASRPRRVYGADSRLPDAGRSVLVIDGKPIAYRSQGWGDIVLRNRVALTHRTKWKPSRPLTPREAELAGREIDGTR
jgi:hypothetical protein